MDWDMVGNAARMRLPTPKPAVAELDDGFVPTIDEKPYHPEGTLKKTGYST
ncbi:MAG: hypothetical protein J2P15_20940 [Micromonosporaceae bacterium]|nr:hypothetical protein [Micromonosporaceae bacterium]